MAPRAKKARQAKEPSSSVGCDTENKKSRHTTGKLSKMMDITEDIFTEVATHLLPMDLLNLSRASRKLRKFVLHKSSYTELMWRRARENMCLPAPPTGLSEPMYAAVVFQRTCFGCSGTRAKKVDYALCVRYCASCWKKYIDTGNNLRRKCFPRQKIDPVIFELNPALQRDLTNDFSWRCFHLPQFLRVTQQFLRLSGTQRSAFVQRRKQLVDVMHEHAQAVIEWERNYEDEQERQNDAIRRQRRQDIEAKLIAEVHVNPADIPSWQQSDWYALTSQPKPLTPRIWTSIKPKLLDCIEKERHHRAQAVIHMRKDQRRRELQPIYLNYVKTLPIPHPHPLPPFYVIIDSPSKFPKIHGLIDEEEGSIVMTPERFDTVAAEELAQNEAICNATIVERMNSSKWIGLDTSDLPALQTPLPLTISEADLRKAIIMPQCPYCQFEETPVAYPYINRGYDDTLMHIRERHLWETSRPLGRAFCYPDDVWTLMRFAAQILSRLGLPPDTLYSDVSEKVVCLCGKPTFQQPAPFSVLVCHVWSEHQWWRRERPSPDSEGQASNAAIIHDNHNFSSPQMFLKLLSEGETYTPNEVAIPEGLELPERIICTVCKRASACNYESDAMSPELFVWHMNAKHLREPKIGDFRAYTPGLYLY